MKNNEFKVNIFCFLTRIACQDNKEIGLVSMLKKIYNLFSRNSSLNRFDKKTADFIVSNRNYFQFSSDAAKNSPIVLVEFNDLASSHISYSYVSFILAQKYGANIEAYMTYKHSSLFKQKIFNIKKYLRFFPFNVYASFGCSKFIEINITEDQKDRSKKINSDVISKISSKFDVENLKINNVWIGDLIYDTYLMHHKEPTIDIASDKFKSFLLSKIQEFIFWFDYIENHNVKAVIVSHCVYTSAFVLRIAVSHLIESYQANVTHLYRLDKNNLFAYNDFLYFPDEFKKLPGNIRTKGLKISQERINKRFSGEVGVDMTYSTKSAFTQKSNVRLIKRSARKKILIATHCFFDSPHSYGNNLFPDFYEWIEFLGGISNITNYDWYIKLHPDYLSGTKEIVDRFLDKYTNIKLLPSSASHHQIIEEGIDFALTVYGTIGFEYAALGIPVINCSRVNPHIAYNFNIHAESIEDYRELLLNLENVELKIDRNQVFEYYFMKNIYNTDNIFFSDYKKMLEEIGGYKKQFSSDVYVKWLEYLDQKKHVELINALTIFIASRDFRMDYRHLGTEYKL